MYPFGAKSVIPCALARSGQDGGYGITPIDVKNAVDNENVELPSGSIEGNTTELTIRTLGLMHTADEFNDLIVKEDNNRIVRLQRYRTRRTLGLPDIKVT